jgi:hypothetical protein
MITDSALSTRIKHSVRKFPGYESLQRSLDRREAAHVDAAFSERTSCMITKLMVAAIAAFTIGSATNAFAGAMDIDPTTGLNTYYYYGPVSEMDKKGLPLGESASKYKSSQNSKSSQKSSQNASRAQGTRVRLLENRPAAR